MGNSATLNEIVAFEKALSTMVEPDNTGSGMGLILGDYLLTESPKLQLAVAEIVAQSIPKVPAFTRYQKWFQTSDMAPRKPTFGDPEFDPKGQRYRSNTERYIAKTVRYERAKQVYEKKIIRHQTKQERVRTLLSHYRADLGGYLQYVMDTVSVRHPEAAKGFFFEKRVFRINESVRRRHTFITGGTGSGKSETIKHLVRHYLTTNTNTALVVLDPHGKLVKDIARFEEFVNNDRLVLIDPNLADKHTVTINPFEVTDISESGLETQCAQLIAAFEQILGGFTMNMLSILPPLVTTLLHRKDSDLSDLVRFLDDKRNTDLLSYAQKHLPYEEHRQFFKYQFHSPNYESTKDALRNRFQAFLNIPTIKRFTCGKSTVNLETLIEQEKVLLFDLSVSGASKSTTKILGQFITALIQGYSMRRERYKNNPKTLIHFFADECQYFASDATIEILGESRKYGLFLTLATQRTEQVGEKILDAILGNVGVFIVGRSLGKTLKRMSSELEIDKEAIKHLKTGDFFVASINRIPIKVTVPFTGNKFKMSSSQWQVLRKIQISQYYAEKSSKAQKRDTESTNARMTFPLPKLPSSLSDNANDEH